MGEGVDSSPRGAAWLQVSQGQQRLLPRITQLLLMVPMPPFCLRSSAALGVSKQPELQLVPQRVAIREAHVRDSEGRPAAKNTSPTDC